jgi:hypothetical protein
VRELPFSFYQLQQRILSELFGEAAKRGDSRAYCFVEVDGQSILNLRQTMVFGKTQSARDRFVSWLRYRCEQQLATEAHTHDNTTEVISADTSDL